MKLAAALALCFAAANMHAQLVSFRDFEKTGETATNIIWQVSHTNISKWNELIASWNVVCPSGTGIHVEVKTGGSKWYNLGYWSSDPSQKRESFPGQKDEFGKVETDTFVVRKLAQDFTVRIEASKNERGEFPKLKYLGISLHNNTSTPSQEIGVLAETKILDVPRRSQLGHEDGSGWCSPTCISMVLAYWGKQLDFDVPTTARAIHDPNWPGTGNWSFNMAYAGQFPGMRAAVHRLDSLKQVRALVAAGIPVPISVSFDFLNGKEKDEGNGHLVVVVGFDGKGNVIINDPWPDPKGTNSIRKKIPQERVIKAWQRSRQTAYLMGPERKIAPVISALAK